MCPVIFRRRRGHPGKPLTGELEPVSQTTRQVIEMLGSPVLQGAVQAGDLLALGTRSSASSKGGWFGQGCAAEQWKSQKETSGLLAPSAG